MRTFSRLQEGSRASSDSTAALFSSSQELLLESTTARSSYRVFCGSRVLLSTIMVALSFVVLSAVAGSLIQSVQAIPSPTAMHPDDFIRRDADAPPFLKRAASCTFPTPPKTSSLTQPITVTGTFDGGNVRFDRGAGTCTSQTEGNDSDAVFLVQSGGTVQNVVIGANQAQGIHCIGPCNLYNVWFEDVCESAITIKQTSGQSNIIGGGAKNASGTVVRHAGAGTVKIASYCVQTFGDLYNSCGNYTTQYKRTTLISQIIGSSGSALAVINPNHGDVAQFDTGSLSLSSVTDICKACEGVTTRPYCNVGSGIGVSNLD